MATRGFDNPQQPPPAAKSPYNITKVDSQATTGLPPSGGQAFSFVPLVATSAQKQKTRAGPGAGCHTDFGSSAATRENASAEDAKGQRVGPSRCSGAPRIGIPPHRPLAVTPGRGRRPGVCGGGPAGRSSFGGLPDRRFYASGVVPGPVSRIRPKLGLPTRTTLGLLGGDPSLFCSSPGCPSRCSFEAGGRVSPQAPCHNLRRWPAKARKSSSTNGFPISDGPAVSPRRQLSTPGTSVRTGILTKALKRVPKVWDVRVRKQPFAGVGETNSVN